MSQPPASYARPPHRRARAATAGLVLTLLFAVWTVPASAAPGDSPSPSDSSSAAKSASPTPSQTPSDAPVASPTSSESPAASPSATQPAEPPATSTPSQLVATQNRAQVGHALRAKLSSREQRALTEAPSVSGRALAAQAEQDDRFVTLTMSDCAPPSGVGSLDILIGAVIDTEFSLDYVVTNGDDVNVTGSITLEPDADDGITEIAVPGLARGTYRVDFFDPDGTEPVASHSVDVIACITTVVSCQGITFANPAGNPEVAVFYYDTNDEDADGDFLYVEPGASARVRTPVTDLTYLAFYQPPGTGDDENPDDGPLVISLAGEGDVTIDQDCALSAGTTATVGCSSGGAAATIKLHVEHPADQSIRYQIRTVQDTVAASGELGAGGTAYDDITARLPGPGEYQYTLFLDGEDSAYETIEFEVLRCVTATVSCAAASFANPSGNPAVTVTFGRPGALDNRLPVRSGQAGRTAWHQSALAWNAHRTTAGTFVESAGGLTERRLTVPQGCSGAGAGGVATGGSAPLAATGAPPVLPLAVLFTLGGALLLGRRRLT